jgi:hypothetical protein
MFECTRVVLSQKTNVGIQASELHIQILGTDLEDMAAGPGTLTVVNRNNDDFVSTPFTITD